MKTLKLIAAILTALLLLAAEGMAMGIFSVDRALSEKTIKNTIAETGIINEAIDEALRDSTVSMGGSYGDLVKSAMKTDAMNNFFAAYLTSAIRSEIYGEQYEEIADDDLMQAFSSAIDEMESAGAIKISQAEESIIKNVIKQELPDLTENLNSLAGQYDATSGQLTQDSSAMDSGVQKVLGRGMQLIMILISAALCAVLIALFWQSKGGFLWSAAVTALAAIVYILLTVLGASGTLIAGGDSADAFVLTLLSHGFKASAIVGVIITCIFVAAYIIWKARDRRRRV